MHAKKILNTIDPFDETIAFETLWALEGITESKLTELFQGEGRTSSLLPTEVLERLSSSSSPHESPFKGDGNSIALTSAIKHGHKTVAVIGTLLDEVYPKENRYLQGLIAREHLLMSQVPFYQYTKEPFQAHKYHFPRRNATMVAISEGTVIVEASESSGTLTQACACIQQGKPLFILDSCFKNPHITWPDRYLALGAIRVKTTDDIVIHLYSQAEEKEVDLLET